jgi:DNA-binding NtrC family response regulator
MKDELPPGPFKYLSDLVPNREGVVKTRLRDKKCEGYYLPPIIKVPSYAEAKKEFEKHYLEKLLEVCEGNVSQAARVSRVERKQFYALMARAGVQPKRKKGVKWNGFNRECNLDRSA